MNLEKTMNETKSSKLRWPIGSRNCSVRRQGMPFLILISLVSALSTTGCLENGSEKFRQFEGYSMVLTGAQLDLSSEPPEGIEVRWSPQGILLIRSPRSGFWGIGGYAFWESQSDLDTPFPQPTYIGGRGRGPYSKQPMGFVPNGIDYCLDVSGLAIKVLEKEKEGQKKDGKESRFPPLKDWKEKGLAMRISLDNYLTETWHPDWSNTAKATRFKVRVLFQFQENQ